MIAAILSYFVEHHFLSLLSILQRSNGVDCRVAIAIESQGAILVVLVGAVEGLRGSLPGCEGADKVEGVVVAVAPCPLTSCVNWLRLSYW